MADALEILKTRRSLREFDGRSISKEDLEKIVDAGRLAPTARNVQPWEFVVVTRRETLDQLAQVCEHGRFLTQSAAAVVVFSKETQYEVEDGSAATTCVLLAAHALGIGSCWIAGHKKDYAPKVAEILGVQPGYKLIAVAALGYATHSALSRPRASKRTLGEVTHWEKF